MQPFYNDMFVMSFWRYGSFENHDIEEAVKLWKDAGFNVGLSFIHHVGEECTDRMLELLDCCYNNGLKLILYDDRIHCHRLRELGETQYKQAVMQSIEEYGKHPAAAAFFVGDEPDKNTLPFAERAVCIVNELSPIPGFVNFFPMWRSKDYIDLMGVRGEEIKGLYSGFIEQSNMKWLAYDCYSGMHAREPEEGMEMYFDNLNCFYDTAQKANVPLWTSLLCTGHWAFKQPSLSDMRWQVSTAVAHGVKGIQWFMLSDNEEGLGDSPINIYNEKQPSYYDMRKVNLEFMHKFGNIIPKLELEEVYHYTRAYGRTQLYAGSDKYLKDFKAKYSDHAVISRFKHRETGNIWYMFVNGSKEAGNYFTYEFCEPYAHLNGGKWLSAGMSCFIELK